MSDNNNLAASKEQKFWGLGQIFFSAGFATPLAGCYLISRNFKLLKLEKHARYVLIAGVLLNFLILPISGIIFTKFFPKAPHIMLPMIFALLVESYAHSAQSKGLQQLKDSGIKRHSFLSWLWVNLILLVLGCLLFYLGVILIFTLF